MERVYTVNLRKGFIKAVRWKKTPRAAKEVKIFISKHLKTAVDHVRLSNTLNNYLWARGIKNPPSRVKVTAIKDDKGFVNVELFGVVKEPAKQEEKPQQREKEHKKEEKLQQKEKEEKPKQPEKQAQDLKGKEKQEPKLKKDEQQIYKKMKQPEQEIKSS